MRQLKTVTGGAAFVALIFVGMSVLPPSGRADTDNKGSQDEKQMISTGLSLAATIGIALNMSNKDLDMVGLGSYLVNTIDCNGCHSSNDPTAEFAPGGNPYLLPGPTPPFFSGHKKFNPPPISAEALISAHSV